MSAPMEATPIPTSESKVPLAPAEPLSDQDWREEWLVPTVMISLAGRCGERRARRPGPDGWRRHLDNHGLIAIHEASHLVVAYAVGRHVNGAAIEVVDDLYDSYRGVAQNSQVALSDETPDHPTFEQFDKLERDFKTATNLAKLAVGHGWLRYLRTLWIRTDGILERHWLAMKMVAQELGATGTVRRARAQELLDRWMPVQGGSLFEAFAGLLNARVEVCDLAAAARWLSPPA